MELRDHAEPVLDKDYTRVQGATLFVQQYSAINIYFATHIIYKYYFVLPLAI